MERFAHFVRRRGSGPPAPSSDPTYDLSALEEALDGAGDLLAAAAETGTLAAASGGPWPELLDDVENLCRQVTGGPPSYDVVRAVSVAWAEASLQYAHGQSCEDPLTGLATGQHLRTRLDATYRLAERDGLLANSRSALVVVELSRLVADTSGLLGSLAMLEVSESLRLVFDGAETIARAGERRAVALVDRDDRLPLLVGSLRLLLSERDTDPAAPRTRVWIEGLPPTTRGAGQLMDELSR